MYIQANAECLLKDTIADEAARTEQAKKDIAAYKNLPPGKHNLIY